MKKLFKERKLFKGGNYMRKYGIWNSKACTVPRLISIGRHDKGQIISE